MIVADASVVIEMLLRTASAQMIEDRLFARGETVHAPHLIDVEVAQVLRRYVAIGEISQMRGHDALRDLAVLPIRKYPHDIFLGRIWELRNTITAYDAVYVALSEVLEAPLLTRDRRLSNASGHRAQIELI